MTCQHKTNNYISFLLPTPDFDRWERQIATPYSELSEAEQKSDMDQVDRYWPLIQEYVSQILTEVLPEEKDIPLGKIPLYYVNNGFNICLTTIKSKIVEKIK